MILFFPQQKDQNARLIQNVLNILHVSEKNAWTLAPLARVEWMLNAQLPDIEPFVCAVQGMRVIHTGFVKSVSCLKSCILFWVRFWLVFLFKSLAGCKRDDECPLTQACIQRECQDPCPYEECGIKAFCTVNSHRARCQCPPGHKGSPYIECKPYECLTDPECHTTLACRNEKCVDPCDCAANADCEARNHRGICTCRPGYTGDPYFEGCRPSKEISC